MPPGDPLGTERASRTGAAARPPVASALSAMSSARERRTDGPCGGTLSRNEDGDSAPQKGHAAQLEATLAMTRTALAQATAERDKLRRAYEQLKEQLELLRRRIFIAKAERIDARQLELEFEWTRSSTLSAAHTRLEPDSARSTPRATYLEIQSGKSNSVSAIPRKSRSTVWKFLTYLGSSSALASYAKTSTADSNLARNVS